MTRLIEGSKVKTQLHRYDTTILAFFAIVTLLSVFGIGLKTNDLNIQVDQLRSQMHSELDRAKRTYDEATIAVEKRTDPPTDKEIADWFRTHPDGSSPPAGWFPNGDPWRNPTAKEMNEALGTCLR